MIKSLITLSLMACLVGCASSRVVQPQIDYAKVERIVIHRSMDQWAIEDEEEIVEIVDLLKRTLRDLNPPRYTYPTPDWTIVLEGPEGITTVFHRDGWIGTREGIVALLAEDQVRLVRLIGRLGRSK